VVVLQIAAQRYVKIKVYTLNALRLLKRTRTTASSAR